MASDPLPIDPLLDDITASLRKHSGLVLVAEPGAGKTTRVPPALLDAGLGDRDGETGQIVVLEPRRIAARAAAARIATERGGRVGEEVGYHVRFDRQAGPRTRILVVTEGILVRMLQRDPLLERVAVVVFDELHERSLDTDLSLAMTRRVQRELRPELRLVAMSATLDAAPVARFLGDAPVIQSEGRRHPVTIEYLDRDLPGSTAQRVADGVARVATATSGDLLAFLPGVGEIHQTAERVSASSAGKRLEIVKLYGDLPADRQDAILRPGGRRRVVLATNVAESSITVPGIGAVVDSGLARTKRFDPATGLDRLELGRISRASAEQRAGRAGRLGPGHCLRLWTAHDDRTLAAHETPEIARVDLSGTVLQLMAWGERDVRAFEWLEAPPERALESALALLRDLGAAGRSGVTGIGQHMAHLPLPPRLARLVVEGHRAGAGRRAAGLAALLSERDVVHRSPGRPTEAAYRTDCDVLDRLRAVERTITTGYGETALGPVDPRRARAVERVAGQIARVTRRLGPAGDLVADAESDALRRGLLRAFPDRVACRRASDGGRALMVGGRGVRLAAQSSVRDAELFLCLDVDDGARGHREGLVRKASAVDRAWLETVEVEVVRFDAGRARVVGERETRYRDLVLRTREVPPDSTTAEATLVEAAKHDLAAALPLDDPKVVAWRTRLANLASWMPEHTLPEVDDQALITLLPVLAAGKRSFAELRRAPLLAMLDGLLNHEQRTRLAREAPERLGVPSGRHLALAYALDEPPVLAVKIQELFGLAETPRIAGGRVPVLLHLLAPNGRPQQITRDLRSFWANTYPEVRKELAGRYPKHPWPTDPWTAEATARARRRRPPSK